MCGIGATVYVRRSRREAGGRKEEQGEGEEEVRGAVLRALSPRGPDAVNVERVEIEIPVGQATTGSGLGGAAADDDDGDDSVAVVVVEMCGAVLHLRGPAGEVCEQPVRFEPTEDAPLRRGAFLWNGEWFGDGGRDADATPATAATTATEESESDTTLVLSRLLDVCDDPTSVPAVLGTIEGPFAFALLLIEGDGPRVTSAKLWYGRDAFGRRSLLRGWKAPDAAAGDCTASSASTFVLSSVTPIEVDTGAEARTPNAGAGTGAGAGAAATATAAAATWTGDDAAVASAMELQEVDIDGVWCLDLFALAQSHHSGASAATATAAQVLYPWPAWRIRLPRPTLEKGMVCEPEDCTHDGGTESKAAFEDQGEDQDEDVDNHSALARAADELLSALSNAVHKRVQLVTRSYRTDERSAVVGVLFSGGLDSVVLAALAHQFTPQEEPIDLLNVCFDGGNSPDRAAALLSLIELHLLFPDRRWQYVAIDVSAQEVEAALRRLRALIRPRDTLMDFSIGVAYWFAARGRGYVVRLPETEQGLLELWQRLLDQSGADAAGAQRPMLRFSVDALTSTTPSLGTVVAPPSSLSSSPPPAPPPPPASSSSSLTPHGHASTGGEDTMECTQPGNDSGQHNSMRCPRPGCKGKRKKRCVRSICRRCCARAFREEGGEPCAVHKVGNAAGASLSSTQTSSGSASPSQETDSRSLVERVAGLEHEADLFQSSARVLLVGNGADEQLAGYGRHRSAFDRGGWAALDAELQTDCTRLWTRNLGRDDRCTSDWGREPRFPYLDEEVVRLLHRTPLHVITDPLLPLGVGDKRVLREVARRLRLQCCLTLAKRAIQFGTRIAKKRDVLAAMRSLGTAEGEAATTTDTSVASESIRISKQKGTDVIA